MVVASLILEHDVIQRKGYEKKRMVVSLVLEHDVIGTVTYGGTCSTMHLDSAGHLEYDGICISLQGENSVCCSSFFFFFLETMFQQCTKRHVGSCYWLRRLTTLIHLLMMVTLQHHTFLYST